MSRAITFNQIKAEVAALSRRKPIQRPLGIRAPGRWLGEPVHVDGETTYSIAQCDSPLALRLALKSRPPSATGTLVKVVITNLDDAAISADIFARLHKQRLFAIDRWSLVQQQFAAESIDPRLVKHDWLADAVVEYLGGRRTTTAKSGFLDAETLWRELLAAVIGLQADIPDLPALLRWSLDTGNVRRFRELPGPLRQGVEDWLHGRAGAAADIIFAVCDKTDRPDSLPLALAAGVLVDPRAAGRAGRSIGRLEGLWFAGRKVEAEDIARIAGEAASLVRTSFVDPAELRRVTSRAETLLAEVDGGEFAHVSPILPLGYAQRLAAFAEAVGRFVADGAADTLPVEEAARRARLHDEAHRNPAETERLEMAMRLVRFLAAERGPSPPAESLALSARGWLRDGSHVDWARSVAGRIAASRELSEAISSIRSAVATIQERRAEEFAKLLSASVTANAWPADLLLIEQLLDRVVTPLARAQPVLLVILDGMSAAVSRELVHHLTRARREWVEIVEAGRTGPMPVLATLPSETRSSRASLLSGRLAVGAVDERNAFASHRGLVEASVGGKLPVLHVKKDLSEDAFADVVREDIASTKRRVVGVIVNAVDDHLAKADQVEVRWTPETIQILGALLHEASSAGRTVILTSDHGHILERGSTARVREGGERWRHADGAPLAADEVLLRGARVLAPGGALVASWSESIRYISATKRGYHGGANPQEMIVPLTILLPASRSDAPSGWEFAPESTPAWWDSDGPRPPTAVVPPPSSAEPRKPAQRTLFDPPAPPPVPAAPPSCTAPGWIGAAITSEVFEDQRRYAPRGYPGDHVIARLLECLDARGGTATSTALARAMGYATIRLPGLLSVAQKVLNVDGYPVLSIDLQSDTVKLDTPLLLVQFGVVDAGAGR